MATSTNLKPPARMPIFDEMDFCKGTFGLHFHTTLRRPAANCASGKISRLTRDTPLQNLMGDRFVKAMKKLNPVLPNSPGVVGANDAVSTTLSQIATAMNAVIASLGYTKGQSSGVLSLAKQIA